MAPVLSTYRLQLRGDSFTFADAENLLDYLDDLGVSHLYLSPILTAVEGSTHGYDVTDPTTVSAALGGAEGLARLSAAARSRGMGLIVDIVPNHVGVEKPEQNAWWWDVLMHGRSSPYASYFDIDWTLDPEGRIVLPVLGSDDDVASMAVDSDVLRLGDLVYPIAPGTGCGTSAEVHDRQHYRLIGWRHGICGYRRFFSITSLAALRQEDRAVFDSTHVEVKRWFAEGLVNGVRIDHPDGLSNPAGYLTWLRELVGPGAWIVIEKILAADEPLEPTLPVAGTTGYDALREIGGVFIDPAGEDTLTALYETTGVVYSETSRLIRELKFAAATDTLASELGRLRRVIAAAAGADHPQLPDAVAALLARIGVYRFDYASQSAVLPSAVAELVSAQPELTEPLHLVVTALAVSAESDQRLQQLGGAVEAKATEDSRFYRDSRLVALNEVGGEPERFGVSLPEFHFRAATRSRLWPDAMITLSTHDTKRSEDVRARIGVLSQVPSLWSKLVTKWATTTPPPDRGVGLFLWQNIFGVWPVDGLVTFEFRTRLHGYSEKSVREAAIHTSWHSPDMEYETAVHRWLDDVLDGPIAAELSSLVVQLDAHARSDSTAQKLIAMTVSGVPDVYQGTELWDDSLVDPDNRRPVNYERRRVQLESLTDPKMRVVAGALRSRRERPDTYRRGDHKPVLATGQAAQHVIAFQRGSDVLVATPRWTVRLAETGWKGTTLTLSDGDWIDRLTGRTFCGTVAVTDLFDELPGVLLEKPRD